jgi:hypothetical protein
MGCWHIDEEETLCFSAQCQRCNAWCRVKPSTDQPSLVRFYELRVGFSHPDSQKWVSIINQSTHFAALDLTNLFESHASMILREQGQSALDLIGPQPRTRKAYFEARLRFLEGRANFVRRSLDHALDRFTALDWFASGPGQLDEQVEQTLRFMREWPTEKNAVQNFRVAIHRTMSAFIGRHLLDGILKDMRQGNRLIFQFSDTPVQQLTTATTAAPSGGRAGFGGRPAPVADSELVVK